MTNLPSYIKPRDPNVPSRAAKALENLGAGAGPYLSLEGGRFALVDAAGGNRPIQTLFVDVCIVDVNDHMSKMYYGLDYKPGQPSPPMCFSDNGVAPSYQARQPQSLTCEMCPHDKWGSKISAMGSEVKACRDEQKIAIRVPGMPNNIFRLTIPPNSLKNWKAYLIKFTTTNFEFHDVVTRIEFAKDQNFTLTFNPAPSPWLDEETVRSRDKAMATRASDMIVGRLDRPRQAVTPAIAVEQQLSPTYPQSPHGVSADYPSTIMAALLAQTATPAPAASPSEPARRRRRTNAEIAAASAQVAAPASMAPFRPETNGAAEPPAGADFGVRSGTAPNPDLVQALKIFDT
jgi:hypothetical protein